MAVAVVENLNVNKLISTFARKYSNLEYVADRILPPVPVNKMQIKYARYDKSNLRSGGINTLSGDTDIAKDARYGVANQSASLGLYRLKTVVGTLEKHDADPIFDPEMDATANLMEQLAVDKEVRMAGVVFATGNYATGNKSAVVNSRAWTNYTTATGAKGPVRQVYSASDVVRQKSARTPNIMAMGSQTYVAMTAHPDIRTRIQYVQSVTKSSAEAALAAIFGVDEVLVVRAIQVTTPEGATDVLADVVTDSCVLIHRPKMQNTKTVAHSVQFRHVLFPNGDKWTVRERMGATVIEGRDAYSFHIVDTAAGYMFHTTNS